MPDNNNSRYYDRAAHRNHEQPAPQSRIIRPLNRGPWDSLLRNNRPLPPKAKRPIDREMGQ